MSGDDPMPSFVCAKCRTGTLVRSNMKFTPSGIPYCAAEQQCLSRIKKELSFQYEVLLIYENDCPGHVASDCDPKACKHCGTHIDSMRPDDAEQEQLSV